MQTGDKKLRPTVVEPPARSPRKAGGASARRTDASAPVVEAGPAVRKPTAIPGAERRRIDVQPQALERLSPGAAAHVYAQATALIGAFVVDKATERKAILWGHDLQQVYSDLVTQALALSRSPVLRKVEGYLRQR